MTEFSSGEADRQALEAAAPGRKKRLESICKAVDANANGYISCSEMFRVVQLLGFPGNEKEYAREYKRLLKSNSGIPTDEFVKMLNMPGGDYFVNESIFPDFAKALNLPPGLAVA